MRARTTACEGEPHPAGRGRGGHAGEHLEVSGRQGSPKRAAVEVIDVLVHARKPERRDDAELRAKHGRVEIESASERLRAKDAIDEALVPVALAHPTEVEMLRRN